VPHATGQWPRCVNSCESRATFPFPDLSGRTVRLKDLMGPASYNRDGNDLVSRDLYLDIRRGATTCSSCPLCDEPAWGNKGGATMRRSRGVVALAVAVALAGATFAQAREFSGVTLPDTLSAGGKTLKLNGGALRKKAVFKVYVGGLYLEAPSKDAGAILAADTAKAVRMHFVRSVSKDQLVDSFKEGFEANAKVKAAAQKTNIDKLYGMLSDVKEGDALTFSYVPGSGTAISKGDKVIGAIEGKDFADALFALWLGPKPPSDDLKKGMLGM